MENREEKLLNELCRMEDLAEKKTKIYSRLLTDVKKAQDMERLSSVHQKAREEMEKLLYGAPLKKKTDRAGMR